MIRIVIAEDHYLIRQGIRALLEKAAGIEVVGEAADGHEAVELVNRLLPDVLVADIAIPGLNGLEAVSRLRALGVKTRALILSMYEDEALVRQALRNGARGYLVKRSITEELLLAVRAVSRGEVFLCPEASGVLLEDFLAAPEEPGAADPLHRLTSRERDVLQLIAEGHTNRTIATHLHLSEKTVEKHPGHLLARKWKWPGGVLRPGPFPSQRQWLRLPFSRLRELLEQIRCGQHPVMQVVQVRLLVGGMGVFVGQADARRLLR
jgi:two-component system, NarL family, response regulator NreC